MFFVGTQPDGAPVVFTITPTKDCKPTTLTYQLTGVISYFSAHIFGAKKTRFSRAERKPGTTKCTLCARFECFSYGTSFC